MEIGILVCSSCGNQFRGNFCRTCGHAAVSYAGPSEKQINAYNRKKRKRMGHVIAHLGIAMGILGLIILPLPLGAIGIVCGIIAIKYHSKKRGYIAMSLGSIDIFANLLFGSILFSLGLI